MLVGEKVIMLNPRVTHDVIVQVGSVSFVVVITSSI